VLRHQCFSCADKSHACTATVMRVLTPLTAGLRAVQERGERLSITFSPLHDKFGVEVVGADLTRALSGDEKALLQARCGVKPSSLLEEFLRLLLLLQGSARPGRCIATLRILAPAGCLLAL